ncbi:AfsR/SARP family transcriptional regulator [Geodermatophilus sp. SYSU D00758]
MRVGVLGPLELSAGEGPVHVPGHRDRALLAVLALARGEVVSTDRIADEIWGGTPPADPVNSVQALVSRLRRLVGADRVTTRPPGYRLALGPRELDAHLFEQLTREGRLRLAGGEPAEAAALLGEALALWRGPVLADLPDLPAAGVAAASLSEARLAAVEDLADARLALGLAVEVVGDLTGPVAEHPLRERLRTRLALALHRSGRQAEALGVLRAGAAHVRDELGLDPGSELTALHRRILAGDPALDGPARPGPSPAAHLSRGTPAARTRGGLPRPRSSFVGRTAELAVLQEALAGPAQVVTLLGPGGVGKTRLAVETARRTADRRPGGTWFVDLAAVPGPAQVPDAVAAALGVTGAPDPAGGPAPSPVARAATALADRPALVLLDNCEHVLDAVADLVDELLGLAPAVQVLATSRAVLDVGGEHVVPLAPLPVGALDDDSEAVRLFLDRARAADRTLRPDARDLAAVREICRRLDGVPLALELAAARARALPLPEIAARLGDRFGLLRNRDRSAAPRQLHLEALVGWSHELLSADERRAFRWLGTLTGPFALDTAEELLAAAGLDPDTALDVVAALVDRSMLAREGDGASARFRMLGILRAYACDRLAEDGEEPAARLAHAQVHLRRVRDAADLVHGARAPEALAVLAGLADEARAALAWATGARRADVAVPLATAFGWFWFLRGPHAEALDAVRRTLDLAGDDDAPALATSGALIAAVLRDPAVPALTERAVRGLSGDPARAVPLAVAALHRFSRGEPAEAAREATLAARIAAGLPEDGATPWPRAWALGFALLVAGAAESAVDLDRAEATLTSAETAFAAADDGHGLARVRVQQALVAEARGDYGAAVARLTAAGSALRRLGLPDLLASVLGQLGNVLALTGATDRARTVLEEALEVARAAGSADVVAYVRNALGHVARAEGDLAAARDHHRAALAHYQAVAAPSGIALTRARLGSLAELDGDLPAAEAHHRAGLAAARATGDRRAVALALEGLAAVAAAGGDVASAGRLLGAAEALRTTAGAPLAAAERADVDRVLARLRQRLDDRAVGELLEEGRRDRDRLAAAPPG